MSGQLRVLICSGATGGHFYPAFCVAQAFKTIHAETEVHILLNKIPEFISKLMQGESMTVHAVRLSAPRNLISWKGIICLLEWLQGFIRSIVLMVRVKPKLIIGFGSFGSVITALLGVFSGIPVLIHEQNAVAGRANQFLGIWADRIAVSFPETDAVWPKNKVFWSGFPVRKSFIQARERYEKASKADQSFTILVFGGSQGAKRINREFLGAMGLFSFAEKSEVAVIHITGNDDVQAFRKAYEHLGICAEVSQYSEEIAELFSRADLVVARSGAGTVFELVTFAKKSILIPYPHAQGHQKNNAEWMVRFGSAMMIEESDLTPERLKDAILDFKNNHFNQQKINNNTSRLRNDEAAETIVQAGWDLICQKKPMN